MREITILERAHSRQMVHLPAIIVVRLTEQVIGDVQKLPVLDTQTLNKLQHNNHYDINRIKYHQSPKFPTFTYSHNQYSA